MTYTEYTFIAFTTWFFFSKFSSSHEIMVEDAAGLDHIKVGIIFHPEWEKSVLKSVSNRMNLMGI